LDGSTWKLRYKNPETIYVNNVPWTRGALSSTNKNYTLNYEAGQLDFGDGTNGAVVPTGASVSMTLNEEQMYPDETDLHLATLDYPTSNDQKRVEISIVSPITTKSVLLKKGCARHQLDKDIIPSGLVITPTFAGGEVSFTDETQTIGSTQYAVDTTNGVLFLGADTSTSTDTIVSYQYYPREVLNDSDWSFSSNGEGITNQISISDRKYKTFTADIQTIPTSVKYFNLSTLGVVKGSVEWGGDCFWYFYQRSWFY